MSVEPYWGDEDVTLYLGKCEEVLPELPANSVDAVVCDPPYDLTSGKKGGSGAASLNVNSPAGRSRISTGGFMGKSWDATGVAFDPATWQAVLRVLKPGGHLLAFGGTRTWHRLVCAIEDAGFEIRDSIDWIYGTGFAKSRNVAKAIDERRFGSGDVAVFKEALGRAVAASGKTRKLINDECGFTMRFDTPYEKDPECWGCSLPTVEQYDVICRVLGIDGDLQEVADLREWPRTRLERLYRVVGYEKRGNSPSGIVSAGRSTVPVRREITAPGTEDASRWEGWGTALKPAHEPIVVARKPLTGTVAANVLAYGTGALNVDRCRVEGGKDVPASPRRAAQGPAYGDLGNDPGTGSGFDPNVGRWPPNILLSHAFNCQPIGLREVRSDGHHPASRGPGGLGTSGHAGQEGLDERKSGTEVVEAWDCAPDCPVAEMDRQSGVLTSGTGAIKRASAKGGTRSASIGAESRPEGAEMISYGDSGGASRYFPVFRYEAKAGAAERPKGDDGTEHETVKPLELLRWMVRLVTQPDGLVLDCFAGSGTTAEACIIEGFRCILIEREERYARLIRKRLSKPIQPVMFGFDDLEAS